VIIAEFARHPAYFSNQGMLENSNDTQTRRLPENACNVLSFI
jgi:hypothetical protein